MATRTANYGTGKVYATNTLLVPSGTANVKFIHCKTNVSFNVYLDGKLYLSTTTFEYESYTVYQPIPSGPHTMQLFDSRGNKMKAFNFSLVQNQNYTLIFHGGQRIEGKKIIEAIDLLMLEDTDSCPTKDDIKIRVVHAGAELPPVDFIIGERKVEGLSYGRTSVPLYFEEKGGEGQIVIKKHKSDIALWGPVTFDFMPNAIYTYIITGTMSNVKYPIILIEIEDSGGKCAH